MSIHHRNVSLRLPTASDASPLLTIVNQPEVALWWVGYDETRVRSEFCENTEHTRIIEVDDEVAGVLLVIRGNDAEYPTTIMHIFIGTQFRGKRVGEEALALAIREEFAAGIQRITLDPNVNNAGAIRSYERMGFQRVGVLRDYQMRPNGELEDGLLLDMIRRDFPEGPPIP